MVLDGESTVYHRNESVKRDTTWIKHEISRVQTLRVPHDDQDDLGGRRVSGFRDPTNVTEFLQFSMNQMGKFYIFLSEMDSC